jgi:hypothetical protein
MEKKIEAQEEYAKPELREYGDLRELTAGNASGTHTDSASGTPAPFVFSGPIP